MCRRDNAEGTARSEESAVRTRMPVTRPAERVIRHGAHELSTPGEAQTLREAWKGRAWLMDRDQ
jgi:hypothetical protein